MSAGIKFGLSSTRPEDDIVPITDANFSTGGLCSTSADADNSKFPYDEPIRFQSTDPAYLSKLGTGPLAAAVKGLNDQLDGFGADIVVVRVAEGTGADANAKFESTAANIIGSAGSQTGLYALRAAAAHVKMAPHLIDVPGFLWQQPDGVTVDNPIRAELPAHLDALRAICVVDVDASTKEASIAARELMSSERMMPLGIAAKVYETVNGSSTLVTRSMSSRVMGLFINTDTKIGGGMPFESIANRAINGLADLSRPLAFDLQDGSCEGQMLLSADVSIVAAGSVAQVGAIASGGFAFVGVESAATTDLWSQIHQVRGQDFLDYEFALITRQYLGPRITPRRAEAWLTALKFKLLDHVNNERILGFKLDFPALINSVEDVRQGILSIETNVEQAPAFQRANNAVRRYRPATQALIDAIVARAGSASAVIS